MGGADRVHPCILLVERHLAVPLYKASALPSEVSRRMRHDAVQLLKYIPAECALAAVALQPTRRSLCLRRLISVFSAPFFGAISARRGGRLAERNVMFRAFTDSAQAAVHNTSRWQLSNKITLTAATSRSAPAHQRYTVPDRKKNAVDSLVLGDLAVKFAQSDRLQTAVFQVGDAPPE
jgi:hypothetical protein